MEHAVLLLFLTLAGVAPASAAQPAEWMLAVQKRPWLLGVYVFVVGLPAILFISFMWPDVRFGPPNQDYYYKKSDDVQPDDPEASEVKPTLETDERVDRALTKRK
ncbi:calmegin-like [Gadus chalcogrammus]|uniref:calmegin-like n=1 Tax=Gadus chalcogrammus TaxID=1042646 RepID=UPI0024C488DD|nr:calmegin-like [Gadus chalcogrammus]